MSFWSWLKGDPSGITANANPATSVGEPGWVPGDPDGVTADFTETFSRSLPLPSASPWSGWPSGWDTPNWGDTGSQLGKLVDTAWFCIDLNSSVLSTMPVYRTQSGKIIPPMSWMTNPDPLVYNSWEEFAKQLFWDYQLGEAFVLKIGEYADGWPRVFRVIPPPMMKVEMGPEGRKYKIGDMPVPAEDVLHIRYKSTTTSPRGVGPLESAGARITNAGVLAKYVSEMVASGGVPHYALTSDQKLTKPEAAELLQAWVDSRTKNVGRPAFLGGGTRIETYQKSAKDMALLELSQWNESLIARQLGVPAFLANLPSGGDSMTYSNVSSLFDFHDRSSLRTKARAVMSAFSYWALPRGQAAELNRDEYTRPAFNERAQGWKAFVEMGAIDGPGVATAERFTGSDSTPAVALSGGEMTGAGAPIGDNTL